MTRGSLLRRALGFALAAKLGSSWTPAPEPAIVSSRLIYMDGGTLDLGVVRDTVLNTANEFKIIDSGEVWGELGLWTYSTSEPLATS